MKMHEGTWDFFKLFIILLSAGLFLFWIRYDFGANIALIVVALCFGTLFFVFGSLFNSYNSQKLLELLSQFNAKDAMIDKFRMQSLKEVAKGEAWKIKADSQKQLIDYKNEQKLIAQQPKQKPIDESDTFWSTNETVNLDEWS